MLFLQSFLRKGVSLDFVGGNHNLKDLTAARDAVGLHSPASGAQGYLAQTGTPPLSCTNLQ